MGFWSAIFKAKNGRSVHKQVKAAGVLKDEPGWYYEESRNFSKTQSTVRIDQQRPGNWETFKASCGIVGLNKPSRKDDVARFFSGTYRWLRLEHELHAFQSMSAIKVIGTFRLNNGKEQSVHLGFLQQELSDELEGEDLQNLWGRIRFIRFPSPSRNSDYLIRFDLMQKCDLGQIA
jgi:hypothetical protein